MRIALITQWYDPEVGSAAIPGAIARALVARGHRVDVITGFPNYPTGRIYDGYRLRPYSRESARGVFIHRLPLYPSHDRSAVRRVLNFVSFMLSSSTFGALVARRADVTLVYSTPGTVGLAGLVLKKLLRRPFVLYVQDVWPDTVTATGMLPTAVTGPVERVLHRFCNAVYRAAEHVAVIAPGMKDLLVLRGVPASKLSVVYNWVDEEVFRPMNRSDQPRSDQTVVMYAGNIGDVQGLDTALRALAQVGDRADIALRLVGSGVAVPALRELASELGIADRVHFEGSRSLSEMAEVMAQADVQLVCLKDDPLFKLTLPSKVQAILASGQPLLTCAPGDAATITEQSGGGWSCPAGDVDGLARLLVRLSQMERPELAGAGARGRSYYENHLAASVGAAALESALVEAVKER